MPSYLITRASKNSPSFRRILHHSPSHRPKRSFSRFLPPCPSPCRSRSSTFGPCGCLHKMPRLFPGMQSSTGVASVLGRNISCYNTSGEGFRIGKVISRAYFSISGCVKFALAVRGEKFALLSNTIFSLPPLVNIQRQLRLRRVSDCRITPTSPSSLSVASLSQRGFLSPALPFLPPFLPN